MPFDGVVADGRRVAGRQVLRDAALPLVGREVFDTALFKADVEAVFAQVADPSVAAGAARVLHHMDPFVPFGQQRHSAHGKDGRSDKKESSARKDHHMPHFMCLCKILPKAGRGERSMAPNRLDH